MAVIRQVITDGNRKHSRTRQKRKPVICRLNEILWLNNQMKPLALYHVFLRILQENMVTFVRTFFFIWSLLDAIRIESQSLDNRFLESSFIKFHSFPCYTATALQILLSSEHWRPYPDNSDINTKSVMSRWKNYHRLKIKARH